MSNWIRRDKRMAIYARDNNSCVYCNSISNLSLDHIIPQSRGGSNDERNLVTSCISCNSSRHNMNIETFISMNSNPKAIRDRIAISVSKRIK